MLAQEQNEPKKEILTLPKLKENIKVLINIFPFNKKCRKNGYGFINQYSFLLIIFAKQEDKKNCTILLRTSKIYTFDSYHLSFMRLRQF